MKTIIEKTKQLATSPKFLAITASSLTALFFIKKYFSGGVCRVTRDLTGHIVVVTGGNTGIGKATIEELSKRNCTIIFGARDEVKSEQAIKEIKSRNKDAKIMQFKLDLSSKDSIKEFSVKVKQQCEKIDVLINNAAVMLIPDRQITANGFEMQMGVNNLGHFYLTYLLWDRLRNAQHPRIINVSSEAHKGFAFPKYNMEINFNDYNLRHHYTPGLAYAYSKAANILFTKQLQRKMDESGFQGETFCLHPGVVRTQLWRYMGLKMILARVFFAPFIYLVMKNPLQGAQTTLYTVLEDGSKLTKGAYYKDCAVCQSSPFTTNMQNASKNWKISQQQLQIEFNI